MNDPTSMLQDVPMPEDAAFSEALIELDMLLTCKPEWHAREMLIAQMEFASSPRTFVSSSRTYYLSDSGFSRIVWNEWCRTLQLSERSGEDVKGRARERSGRLAAVWEQIEHMLRCAAENA